MHARSAGVLLHVTSLPGRFGIGDFGPEAYAFVDWLAEAGVGVWQILPLTPTALASHNDPYHGISAFAGNPLLISPELLVRDGWLEAADISDPPTFPDGSVDFAAVSEYKYRLFDKALEYMSETPEYHEFAAGQASWLEDYALFAALKKENRGAAWNSWPEGVRDRRENELDEARTRLSCEIRRLKLLQFLFHTQWRDLREHCRKRGVQTFGDMPIYVDYDSAELWTRGRLFKLDDQLNQTAQAGVPPDYFSATGQLWKSPVYDWPRHEEERFDWWMSRIERNLELFDVLRIDHFRGLVAYWEVPADADTALGGKWVEAPVKKFFSILARRLRCMSLVAEDLGVITPDVREMMTAYNLPGMKILQFAFGEDMPENAYMPHNMESNSVAYTGTHDNNPTLGWWDEEADAETRKRVYAYLGREVAREELPWELIRTVMFSPADWAVIPAQDLIGLGKEARMNRPGNLMGNWWWRMRPGLLTEDIQGRLKSMIELSGRSE